MLTCFTFLLVLHSYLLSFVVVEKSAVSTFISILLLSVKLFSVSLDLWTPLLYCKNRISICFVHVLKIVLPIERLIDSPTNN